MSAGNALVVVRHGETAWSEQRRHTGRTDIPLERGTAGPGRAALAPMLADLPGVEHGPRPDEPAAAGPRHRPLAGFGDRAVVDDDLAEWDYGEAEGRRTVDIREDDPGLVGVDARDRGRRAAGRRRPPRRPGDRPPGATG